MCLKLWLSLVKKFTIHTCINPTLVKVLLLVCFQDLVVIGAPGSYYWTGTIKVYNLSSDSFYSPNKDNIDSHRYSYLGESPFMTMAEQL